MDGHGKDIVGATAARSFSHNATRLSLSLSYELQGFRWSPRWEVLTYTGNKNVRPRFRAQPPTKIGGGSPWDEPPTTPGPSP